MANVIAEMSMSLDGFITGPDDDVDRPLGRGGERLHEWVYGLASWRERHGRDGGEAGTDSAILEEAFERTGAIVMGRRMFDLGEGPWGDEPPFHVPVFVVTHEPRETLVKAGGTTFSFVSGGIRSALEQAREAADNRDVSVAGGGETIQQFVEAGLLDELQIHLVPVLLGDGRRLFERMGLGRIELQPARVIDSPSVTHLLYRVVK